jgi:hypothetical protein
MTCRPRGAKPQVKGAQGPTDHTLSRIRLRLGGYASKLVYKRIPCLKVGGDRVEWSASHMDGRPAVHQLQTDSIKSVEAPLDLYIRILAVELRTHHNILVVLHL